MYVSALPGDTQMLSPTHQGRERRPLPQTWLPTMLAKEGAERKDGRWEGGEEVGAEQEGEKKQSQTPPPKKKKNYFSSKSLAVSLL